MNERIRQLAEQAMVERASGFKEFDVDLFAELIIKECINIAYEHDKPKLSGPGLRIAMSIESHFDIYIEEDGRFVK